MEVQKLRQSIVSKNILDPFGKFTFNTVDPIRPMASARFHWFVEFVGNGFPSNDDDVSHSVEVIPLGVEFFSPLPPWYTLTWLMAGKEPANNWSQDQYHAHHDIVRVHGLASRGTVLCLRTILCGFGSIPDAVVAIFEEWGRNP